jgi:hypothetical protein
MTQTDAGTILSNLRNPYAIGGDTAELATVEGKTQDGEYQCRLCPYGQSTNIRLIHRRSSLHLNVS